MSTSAETMKTVFGYIHEEKSDKVLEMLNQKAFDVNTKNAGDRGKTVLHEAALFKLTDLVKTLVNDHNADINIRDNDGFVAMQTAVDSNNVEIVRFLLEKGSEEADYAQYVLNDSNVQQFLDAVEANNIQLVKQIMDRKTMDVNVLDKTHYKRTALAIAATKGHEDMVKLLVEQYNADIDISDEIGEYPVHNAADNGHKSIAKYLVERGSAGSEDVEEFLQQ